MATRAPHRHIDVLDGLRAVAILLVMWLHTWQLSWMSNDATLFGVQLHWGAIPETGFLGVELFFFISGFCLFYPYARQAVEGAGAPKLGTYVYRRAIKILPSYWLAIAAVILLVPPGFGSPLEWAWQLGAHLLFVHNWFLGTRDTLNGVFWSLGVEVQFYVLFPLFAAMMRRWPVPTYLGLALLAVAWRMMMANHLAPGDLHFWADQLPGYLDFFAGGMATAYMLTAWREKPAFQRPWLWSAVAIGAIAALSHLVLGLYAVRYSMPFWPAGWQVVNRSYVALAFMAITLGVAGGGRVWRWLLANRAMVFLSTISYNLYLWHQVVARLLYGARIPAPATQDPHADPTWQWHYMVAAWGGAIALSALITYAFERPLLQHGVRGALRKLLRREPPAEPAELRRTA